MDDDDSEVILMAMKTIVFRALMAMMLAVLFTATTACPANIPSSLTQQPSSRNTFTKQQEYLAVQPRATFFLSLPSNPSTGFTWSVHTQSDVQVSHAVRACHYDRDSRGDGHSVMVGVGGVEVWEFVSGASGTSLTIALQYQRPWLPELPEPTHIWHVTVL